MVCSMCLCMCVSRVHQGCQREARRKNEEGAGGKARHDVKGGSDASVRSQYKDRVWCLKRSPEHEVQAPSPRNYETSHLVFSLVG